MSRRVAIAALVAMLLGIALWRFWPDTVPVAAPSVQSPQSATLQPDLDSAASITLYVPNPIPTNGVSHLADALNSPKGSINADLQIVSDIFESFRSNFLHSGNPVGDNMEITAALTGRNPLALALIPENHPAIDSRGELCDRWGTPFFFHQLSGTHMEIRSAGPDRKFRSDDDVVFEP